MTSPSNLTLDAAKAYVDAGISVLPTSHDKIPTIKWKPRTAKIPTSGDVERDFSGNGHSVAIIGGAVSGNLECIDFDFWSPLDGKKRPVSDNCVVLSTWGFFGSDDNQLDIYARNTGTEREDGFPHARE